MTIIGGSPINPSTISGSADIILSPAAGAIIIDAEVTISFISYNRGGAIVLLETSRNN